MDKDYNESKIQSFLFDSFINSMNVNFYVTDIDTYEIIFMSDTMRKNFNIDDPEGKICWQVLQEGITEKCRFCPLNKLDTEKESESAYIWEEHNTVTGCIYQNYDSIIRWVDGRLVHVQHSIDITEVKRLSREANVDELTNLLNRRSGKFMLDMILKKAAKYRKTVVLCMLDLNGLKQINDIYGHLEGDKSLVSIAGVISKNLGNEDFAFRLSGDEFIIVFYMVTFDEANDKVKEIQRQLILKKEEDSIPYELSFCYGLLEVPYDNVRTISELISKVDEKMYIQKRYFHIKKAQEELTSKEPDFIKADEDFDYDRDHLYDALTRSTDDYIYIGNMKTGTFRYSTKMVKEFNLPGEIIPDAAAIWGSYVHPNDKEVFLEANQDIADGRSDVHNVEYRAKNRDGKWIWLNCRGYLIRDKYGEPDLFAGIILNLSRKNNIDHIIGTYNELKFREDINNTILNFPNNNTEIMILDIKDVECLSEGDYEITIEEVMKNISSRLKNVMLKDMRIYSISKGRLAIFFINPKEESLVMIKELIDSMSSYNQEYRGKMYSCAINVKYTSYPKGDITVDDIIK